MTDDEMVARCRAIPSEISQHKAAMVRLATERVVLLQELRRRGMGLGQLGELMGLTRGRIQQLTGPR